MKKTLGKPENWQDFESLCKKLWGEIWGIPNTIKKNGRLGQQQAGVDVFGIPKGQNQYWGIQAKGKDDYSDAKLTETEISEEIEKAKKFQPKLKTYIIASTSNKDSKIEQFVRLKDIENQKEGSFEILLFCWEDIVDLIEDNQGILNWYQHGIGQKGKFDFRILFNDMQEHLILKPTFEKTITRCKLTNKSDAELLLDRLSSPLAISGELDFNPLFPFRSNKINKSWCDFEIVMENIGSAVIEDWRVILRFVSGVSRLDNDHPFFPNLSLIKDVDDENKTITYRPIDNSPLIQTDNRYFDISLLPEPNSDSIIMEWELLARDYCIKESVEIRIEPEFIEEITFMEVNKVADMTEDEVYISYYVVEKTNDK
ncbi:MAG: hypothetical protein KF687_06380 [Cyclobacteriaceae bacterium]|nr:hypothetical protein [Cyclobacteriaceae bacterium]